VTLSVAAVLAATLLAEEVAIAALLLLLGVLIGRGQPSTQSHAS
jgi:hypothetical protein